MKHTPIKLGTLAATFLITVLAPQSGNCFYNSSAGRWLSRDPIGLRGGLNAFSLAGNDPIRFIDLLGAIKKGDRLEVTCKGCKSGYVEVTQYYKMPSSGEHGDGDSIGAHLQAVPHIDGCCECGGCYKWRQYVTEKYDDKTEKSFLDIGNRDPNKDGEWYGGGKSPAFPPGEAEAASACGYTFKDTPSQLVAVQVLLPDSSPNNVKKVTVNFTLPLVKVPCGDRKGGDVVLTISWGFWYTKDKNGILNNESIYE